MAKKKRKRRKHQAPKRKSEQTKYTWGILEGKNMSVACLTISCGWCGNVFDVISNTLIIAKCPACGVQELITSMPIFEDPEMQTFLPLKSFKESLQCLDDKRLGKQRVEAKQILDTLLKKKTKDGETRKGWINHPAVRMWRGYENALRQYYNTCLDVWEGRGFVNNMRRIPIRSKIKYPTFIGNKNFHNSHKSNLLRKDPEYYGNFCWDVPANLPYVWPGEQEER